MTDRLDAKTLEPLSALMDGEVSAQEQQETLDKLLTSEDLRRTWDRYHMIRSVLQNTELPQKKSQE